jgi:hypothetical protein
MAGMEQQSLAGLFAKTLGIPTGVSRDHCAKPMVQTGHGTVIQKRLTGHTLLDIMHNLKLAVG